MSELKKMKHLIENLGYIPIEGHWGSYGILIVLEGEQHGKKHLEALHIERSNPEFHEIFRYIVEKHGSEKKP